MPRRRVPLAQPIGASGNNGAMLQYLEPRKTTSRKRIKTPQDDTTRDLKMTWALSDGTPVSVSSCVERLFSTKRLHCVICDELVYYRQAHTRHRNGVPYTVRAHFVHRGQVGQGSIHSNESIAHKVAKRLIHHHHTNIKYTIKCVDCHCPVELKLEGSTCEEKNVQLNGDNYRLDIGLLDTHGTLVGCVEVYATHAIGTPKANAMSSSGLAWCEVSANHVIASYTDMTNTGEFTLSVRQCHESQTLRCINCLIRQEEQKAEAEEWEAQQLLEAKRQRRCVVDYWGNARVHVENEDTAFNNRLVKIMQQEFPELKGVAKRISKRLNHPEGLLTFGKHCGKHILELWKNPQDPFSVSYVRWIAGYTGYRTNGNNPLENDSMVKGNTPTLRTYARSILKGHCLLCFTQVDHWKHWCAACFYTAIDDESD
jgi:hypothetical protein